MSFATRDRAVRYPTPASPASEHRPPRTRRHGRPDRYNTVYMVQLSDFDRGLVVGLLIGDGSFGGDGKQPQVTLRMHVRHEAVFRWLVDRFPGSRLYGPYHHGGRSYYQWMARGKVLVRDVLPLLEEYLGEDLDGHAADRLRQMNERYAGFIERERASIRGARAGQPGDHSR